MRSELEIDSGSPEKLRDAVDLSLESGEKVDYSLSVTDNMLRVETETDGIGVLRGCTDTVFRLTSLATKLYSR